MGLVGGSLTISTAVKAVGKLAAQGNTAANSIPDVSRSVSGGTAQTCSFGTGSGAVNIVCSAEYILSASGTLTIDLYSGGVTSSDLPDLFNGAAPFRLVKGLSVEIVDGGDTSGVRVGGAASNEWVGFFAAAGDKYLIFPGGPSFLGGSPAGVAVTSTTKNLLIENLSTSASVTVRVTAGGTSVVSGQWTGFWSFLTYA